MMIFWEKDISSRRNYTANGIELSNAEFVKYLGVTITRNLSWGKHIRKACGKANRKLGFVKTILGKCPKKVKEISYLTLVRPHLEYAASVWDPFEAGLIAEINRVQRRAARFVMSCYDRKCIVSSMLRELGWES